MFSNICNESLEIHSHDGASTKSTKGRISKNVIIIPDARVPLVPGDVVQRTLPSGTVERFIVTDPGFTSGTHGIPAHYQARFRRSDAPLPQPRTQSIHVSGANARVNLSSVDQSSNVVQILASSENGGVAAELQQLRKELLARAADDAEQYATIGKVAEAEKAAKDGDVGKAQKLLGGLGTASVWVLKAARDLGLKLATEYISARFK